MQYTLKFNFNVLKNLKTQLHLKNSLSILCELIEIVCYTTDKPEILTMKYDSKTASNAGMSAKLHCRAVGAPTIHFTWKRDDSKITGVSEKYIVEEKKVNIIVT